MSFNIVHQPEAYSRRIMSAGEPFRMSVAVINQMVGNGSKNVIFTAWQRLIQ